MRELKLGERHLFSLVVLVSTLKFCPLGSINLIIHQVRNEAVVLFYIDA